LRLFWGFWSALSWVWGLLFRFCACSDPEVAELSLRPSSKGNYVSFTARELMMNPDAVVERYQKARDIKGLISL